MKFSRILVSAVSVFLISIGVLAQPDSPQDSVVSAEKVFLLLDSAVKGNPRLPRNWRSTSDRIRDEMLSKSIPLNSKGLDRLDISGSAEFSREEIVFLKSEKLKNKKVFVVDLRQESHGLINGNAVSWFTEYDAINRGKSYSEVTTDEANRLALLKLENEVSVTQIVDRKEPPNPGNWKTELILIRPESITTEEKMLNELDLGYFRIAAPDYQSPREEDVDRFVSFVKSLPQDSWLHFHCFAGRGRTTTFMTLYDMMRNYDKASDAEIIDRQRALGGVDLAAKPKETDPYLVDGATERASFVRRFYRYCQTVGPKGFDQSWSEWSQSENARHTPLGTEALY